MLIMGCLILSQIRVISNFVNSTAKFDPSRAENEYKLQYIENEKRKFAASKGLTVVGAAEENRKIPYLDDDAVDGTVDNKTIQTSMPEIQQHAAPTLTTDDITAFCGSCTWNNTNINCDARVDFMMRRYPEENPTRDGTKQSILKKGFCVDPSWAPEFIDTDIASVESEMASILRNHSEGDDVTNSSILLRNSSSSIVNNTIISQTASQLQSQSFSQTPIHNISSTAIDLVSLTTNKDFFILFNNSAITSWIRHIQNVRSITFIGPPRDYNIFQENMRIHYPQLVDATNSSSEVVIPIRWVNETHWLVSYKKKYRCPYWSVCQQLIKLFVFDLRTKQNMDIGNNILILDSDTVWSRDVTFVHDDGTVTYIEVLNYERGEDCTRMDPVAFTEGITMGRPTPDTKQLETVTPYTACRRAEYPNATGKRHIAHHMLFQYDVMMHLHDIINKAWSVSNIWEAFVKCHNLDFCKSRVSEYELYYSFISFNYPERVHLESLLNGENFIEASAVCTAHEMECCRKKDVLLKGCHDHRIDFLSKAKNNAEKFFAMGDMCC